jgi:hypothetical protein
MRTSDRERHLACDLTKSETIELLSRQCSYCGETKLTMSLDRIDNALGHTRANVIPACVRCNFVRKDMPYEAWLTLAPAMRAAREAGLFGDWTGDIHETRRRKLRKTNPLGAGPHC